jgi:hypothetical protein
MKQRITVAELNKLPDEQKELLIEWYQSIEDYTRTPLLSIGQMIAFIQEKKPQLKGISKNRFDKWFVNLDTAQLGYKDELCDALWDTVKQLLKAKKSTRRLALHYRRAFVLSLYFRNFITTSDSP